MAPRRPVIFWYFCAYVTVLALLTLAPPPISMSNGLYGTNLVPLLHSMSCFVPNPGQPSTTLFCVRSIVGNVMMFAPLGIIVPLFAAELWSARRVVLVALGSSVSIEVLQFFGRYVGNPRWSDVDDVIFNVVGAMVGYGVLVVVVAHAKGGTRTPADRSAGSWPD